MTRFSLSVIIVTYNSAEVIEACLEGLHSSDDLAMEIIVVDNCSSDGTADLVQAKFPLVQMIRSSRNLGFAAAVNLGSKEVGGDNIALINPDAIVSSAALVRLMTIQRNRKNPSVIAPLIVQPHGRLRIVSAGHFPSSWRMLCHYIGMSRLTRRRIFEGHYLLEHQLEPVHSVDWVTGAVWVVPTSEWKKLGGLTERWFMYAEDVEFCWRAKADGLEVLLARDVTATHLVGGSSGNVQSIRADWVVNLYDFYRHSMKAPVLGRITWKVVVSAGLMSRAIIYGMHALRVQGSDKRGVWLHESKRFRIFATQLLKVKVF